MSPVFHQWCADYGIPAGALLDLQHRLAPPASAANDAPSMSEAGVFNTLRLAAAARGGRLFRNNLGAMQDPRTGRVVRYGLANESKQMNAVVKSGDGIGWLPFTVELHHVGLTVAQFASVEVKVPGARTDPERLAAQERWRDLVLACGGYAVISTGELP